MDGLFSIFNLDLSLLTTTCSRHNLFLAFCPLQYVQFSTYLFEVLRMYVYCG